MGFFGGKSTNEYGVPELPAPANGLEHLQDRPLPHNVDAERCVLGCVLIDPGCIPAVSGSLEPWHFYRPEHVAIFEALQDLVKNGVNVDVVSLMDQLRRSSRLDMIGGMDALLGLMNMVTTAANVDGHIKTVRWYGARRAGIRATQTARESFYDDNVKIEDVMAGLDQLRNTVLDDRAEASLSEAIPDAFSYIERLLDAKEAIKQNRTTDNPPVVPTRMRNYDNIITGIWAGEMAVIAARPSVGKTAFALQCITNMRDHGHLMFSMEMSRTRLILRFLSQIGGVNLRKVMSGNGTDADWQALVQAAQVLKGRNIVIDDRQRLTVGQIRARAHRAVKEEGVKDIWLDYLQLIKYVGSGQKNREQQVSEISAELKAMAAELDVGLVVLAQLNRQAEGAVPNLSHLRESGAIEQDADAVTFLHRDRDQQEMLAIVAKQRNGPTDKARLVYRLETQQIGDFSGITDDDIPPGVLYDN